MRKFLTLLIFSLVPGIALAQNTAPPLQRCLAEADIKGDAAFYMQYGRDSWVGEMVMNCSVPTYNSQRTMTVIFNSASPGFGIGAGSTIHISVSLITTIPINKLQVVALVAAKTGAAGALVWPVESASIQGTVTITGSNATVQRSLELGNLMIR